MKGSFGFTRGRGQSRIPPPPSSIPRKNNDKIKKYAALAAASIDEQKAMMDEIEALSQDHESEVASLRSQIEVLSDLNNQFVSVTLDRASTWVQQFDENFVHFFESQAQLAITFGKKIDQLHSRFIRVKDALKNVEDVQKMKAQIEQFEVEKQQFTTMIEQVEAQLNEIAADRESLQRQLEEKNQTEQSIPPNVTARIEELEKQLHQTTQALAAKDEEINSLVSMNDVLVGKIQELEHETTSSNSADLENEITKLKQQLDKVTTEYCALELSQGQVNDEQVQALLREKDSEIEYLRHQLNQGANDDSLERIEALSKKLDEKDMEIDAMEETTTNLSKENDGLKAQIAELQQQLETMTPMDRVEHLEQELAIEQEKLRESEEKVASLETECDEMQSQLNDKTEEVSELHEQLDSALAKLEKTEKVVTEKEAVQSELQQVKAMMLQEKEEKQELLEKLAEAEQNYEAQRVLNEALENRVNETAENEREELLNQITTIEERNEKLLIRASEADLLEEKVKELDEEIKQCKTMIDTYKKIGETVQSQLDEARAQNHYLCEQIKMYHPPSPAKKASISCSPIKELKDSNGEDNREREIMELQNTVSQQKLAFEELSRAVKDAREVAQQRENDMKMLHAKLTELTQKKQAYEKAIKDEKATTSELQTRCSDLLSKYEEELEANHDLSMKLKNVSDELAEVRVKYAEEQSGRAQFLSQLRGMVGGASTESSIISAVSAFTHKPTESNEVTNVRDLATRMSQLAARHISQMDGVAKAVQGKCGLVVSAASRIEKSVQSGSRRELSRLSGMTSPFSTERKPLSVLKKPHENTEAQTLHDFSKISRVVFAPRDRPAAYESMTPRVRKPVFA